MNERTIIVTGAAGGLGSALSLACAASGFNTVMLDCDRRGLEVAYDRIVDAGFDEPVLHPLDLAGAGPEDLEQMVDTIRSTFGGLDALVHCAARFDGLSPLDQISPSEWLMQMQVNLNAAWLLSVHCLPLLREAESAHLYFLLEDLEQVVGPYWGAYGVSKHALRALVKQFHMECGSFGIEVLGIDPGPLRSNLRSKAFHSENPASQPDPEPLANRILQLLRGDVEPAGVFVEL